MPKQNGAAAAARNQKSVRDSKANDPASHLSSRDHSSPLVRWTAFLIHRVLIVPTTNLTPTAVEYQLHIMNVFHESWIAFLSHLFLMPCVVLVTMRLLGTQLIACLLAFVWAFVALYSGRKLWAAVNVLCVCGLYFSLGRFEPYLPENSLQPLLWLCLAIALSHISELSLPPRAKAQPGEWVSMRQLLRNNGILHGIAFILISLASGTVQELIATFRVFPIFVLKAMHRLGYAHHRAEATKNVSHSPEERLPSLRKGLKIRDRPLSTIEHAAEFDAAIADPVLDYSLPPQSHKQAETRKYPIAHNSVASPRSPAEAS